MDIIAKYWSQCSKCGVKIAKGEKVDWNRDTKTTQHIICPEGQHAAPAKPKVSQSAGYRAFEQDFKARRGQSAFPRITTTITGLGNTITR